MNTSFLVTVDKETFAVRLLSESEIDVNGEVLSYDFSQLGGNSYSLILKGAVYPIQHFPDPETTIAGSAKTNTDNSRNMLMRVRGRNCQIRVDDHRSTLLKSLENRIAQSSETQHLIRAPMPGLIARIEVKPGEAVTVGKGLLVLEAMKMENEIRSLYQGRVRAVHVETGKTVEKGELLITIEEVAQR